jgi:hypothetical protein
MPSTAESPAQANPRIASWMSAIAFGGFVVDLERSAWLAR